MRKFYTVATSAILALTSNVAADNSVTYQKKVVIEEGTSTSCTYCPRGAVSLDMWHQIHGSNVIPIAVHHNMPGTIDPMTITGGDYLRGLGIRSLPSGRVNRTPDFYIYFQSPDEIDNYLAETADAQALLSEVDYNAATREFEVNYLARMGYTNSEKSLSMAAIVVEDNVSGTTTNYNQSNNFSGTSKDNLIAKYGEEWWPAWQKFVDAPRIIPASDMVYNHVARGIFPSYGGQNISTEWECDKFVAGTIKFVMPESVIKEEETSIVIILIDDESGEIVGADYVGHDRYNVLLYSGVDALTATHETEPVNIYNTQGICLKRNASREDINILTPGLYVVGGKKVIVR